MPSSIRSAPAAAAASPASARRVERRVAAHQVRHQRGALAVRGKRGRDPVGARRHDAHEPSASTSARSLSPRPDSVIRSRLPAAPGLASTQATACAGSSAGRIPSSSATRRKAARASVVRDRHVADPPAVAQVGVLGADARVVEAGRDRVRLQDLPLLVLEHGRQRAVQHPARPRGQRRRVAARLEPLARRLDPDERDLGVVHEAGEGPDRVRAAAHARDHAVGQPAGRLEQLGARLVADRRWRSRTSAGIRRRPDRRADHVVRGLDVRRPSRGSPPRPPP